ncbi:unnamed protein product [Pseudo-nitzschia multistriata]|uniref:Uncharacterized protein n=1 Tax=Pseudo-nitzschia multistriata TaxID=183589 RepID=A0A448YZX2_9STRA|nr:unnamed protein product [Pseudo-nitzschia multistriata]
MHQRKPLEAEAGPRTAGLSLSGSSSGSFASETNGSSSARQRHAHSSSGSLSRSPGERARKQRILALHSGRTQWSRLFFLGLWISIGAWGLVGTWMVLEVRRELLDGGADSNLRSRPIQGTKTALRWPGRKPAEAFQRISEAAPECYDLEDPSEITLTLVTQVSHDRLWMMEHHCDRYRVTGPEDQRKQQHRMSIAVYSNATKGEIVDELEAMGCGVITNPESDDATYNEVGVEVSVLSARTHGAWNNYPVNELRNLALSRVRTTHILYLDVDFWPSDSLYEMLLGDDDEGNGPPSPVQQALLADPRQALVIPAFQLWRQCAEWADCRGENLPHMEAARTLHGLAHEVKTYKSVSIFDPTNVGGHGSTSYPSWFRQAPGSVLPIDCLQSNRYEPFVVVRYCRDLPPFQKAFAGYGKNKVTWVMHLVAAGYVFRQVGGTYLIHYPHLDSASRQHWNNSGKKKEPGEEEKPPGESSGSNSERNSRSGGNSKRSRVDHLFVEFKDWLADTIPSADRRLPLCDDAQDDDGKLWVDHHSPKRRQHRSGDDG